MRHLTAFLFIGLVVGCASRPQQPTFAGAVPGGVAPAFSLPSTTGEDVQLKDYAGRRVVIAFFNQAYTPV